MLRIVSVCSGQYTSLGEPELNLRTGRKLQFSGYSFKTILIVETSAWSIFIEFLQHMLKVQTFHRVLVSPKATCP